MIGKHQLLLVTSGKHLFKKIGHNGIHRCWRKRQSLGGISIGCLSRATLNHAINIPADKEMFGKNRISRFQVISADNGDGQVDFLPVNRGFFADLQDSPSPGIFLPPTFFTTRNHLNGVPYLLS